MLRQRRSGDVRNDSRQKRLRPLLHIAVVLLAAAGFADCFQLPQTRVPGRTHALNISVVPNDSPQNEGPSRVDQSKTQLGVSTLGTESLPSPLEPNQMAYKLRKLRWLRERKKRLSSSTTKPSYQWTKQNLAIALPALMGLLADPLLSMVDTAFVGRSAGGAIDLAALGVCTSIFHMAFTVFRASTVATTSLVGSASTPEEKRQVTAISLGFAGVMGSLVLLALRLGGGQMLQTMGVSPSSSIYKSACSYLFTRCWAAPAVVGIVVSEGAFRGNGDNKTPLVAASLAAVLNLVLDPLLMFTFGMGMTGAAAATAISQLGAAALFARRLSKRRLLPQPEDRETKINVGEVIKSILGANASMLAKNFSMLVFYTAATSVATRIGAAHVATHQVCLSLFWLLTMWLDSGGVSAQLLLSRTLAEGDNKEKVNSLMKYMLKFALAQGLAFLALVFGMGRFVPGAFTSDATVIHYISQVLPHIAIQQTMMSLILVLEGFAIGGSQFRFMASGTAVATAAGVWQLLRATSVVDIWAAGVNTFFGIRFINAIIGVARVHLGLRKKKTKETPIVTDSTVLPEAASF